VGSLDYTFTQGGTHDELVHCDINGLFQTSLSRAQGTDAAAYPDSALIGPGAGLESLKQRSRTNA
jgi:hypothetical protein